MSIMLILLIGLVVVAIIAGGVIALVLFLVKRNKSNKEDAQLTERVKSLEMEVHGLKEKMDRIESPK